MNSEAQIRYFLMREGEQRDHARRAREPDTARFHEALAGRYGRLAEEARL